MSHRSEVKADLDVAQKNILFGIYRLPLLHLVFFFLTLINLVEGFMQGIVDSHFHGRDGRLSFTCSLSSSASSSSGSIYDNSYSSSLLVLG